MQTGYIAVRAGRDLNNNFPAPLHPPLSPRISRNHTVERRLKKQTPSGDHVAIVWGAPERYVFPTLSFGLNTLTSMERKTSSASACFMVPNLAPILSRRYSGVQR